MIREAMSLSWESACSAYQLHIATPPTLYCGDTKHPVPYSPSGLTLVATVPSPPQCSLTLSAASQARHTVHQRSPYLSGRLLRHNIHAGEFSLPLIAYNEGLNPCDQSDCPIVPRVGHA